VGLHTAACSATSRKVSVHLMNSTFFSLSDYIVSGVKKSFWEPSECKKHLIHCRQHTNYMTITNYSLSHHTLLTGGGECLRKASIHLLQLYIVIHQCIHQTCVFPPCIHTCHAQASNAMQTCMCKGRHGLHCWLYCSWPIAVGQCCLG